MGVRDGASYTVKTPTETHAQKREENLKRRREEDAEERIIKEEEARNQTAN